MSVGMFADMCAGMFIDMCVDTCADMCLLCTCNSQHTHIPPQHALRCTSACFTKSTSALRMRCRQLRPRMHVRNISLRMSAPIHTHMPTRMRTHAYTHIYTHVCTLVCTHARTHVYTHAYTHVYAHGYSLLHTGLCTCLHVRVMSMHMPKDMCKTCLHACP